MTDVTRCPALNKDLTCGRNDDYASHMSLTHRDVEAGREWGITLEDRQRWGVAPVKKTKSSTQTEEETSNATGDHEEGAAGGSS